MSTPPNTNKGTECGFDLNCSSDNRSSVKAVSEVLPDFLHEPLYEFNSVRFKVNKQGISINNQTNNRNGQVKMNSSGGQNLDDSNLLPPEFQIDSDSDDAEEDSDSSLGEDDADDSCSNSDQRSSSESELSNPLL